MGRLLDDLARHVERHLGVFADEGLEGGLVVERVGGGFGDGRREVALAEGEAVQQKALLVGEFVPDRLAVVPAHFAREEQMIAEPGCVEGARRREEMVVETRGVAVADELEPPRELEACCCRHAASPFPAPLHVTTAAP